MHCCKKRSFAMWQSRRRMDYMAQPPINRSNRSGSTRNKTEWWQKMAWARLEGVLKASRLGRELVKMINIWRFYLLQCLIRIYNDVFWVLCNSVLLEPSYCEKRHLLASLKAITNQMLSWALERLSKKSLEYKLGQKDNQFNRGTNEVKE